MDVFVCYANEAFFLLHCMWRYPQLRDLMGASQILYVRPAGRRRALSERARRRAGRETGSAFGGRDRGVEASSRELRLRRGGLLQGGFGWDD